MFDKIKFIFLKDGYSFLNNSKNIILLNKLIIIGIGNLNYLYKNGIEIIILKS